MSNSDSPLPGNVTFPGYNSTAANTSNIDQGPEIGHTGHYLGGVIGGPIGGAVCLALIVLVWLMFERRRHDPTRKSTAPSQGSQNSMLEQDQYDHDLESFNPPSNTSQSTDGERRKQRGGNTPHRYWGDL
ncbi:hypothetical protein LA080_009504 [Diaporthe eres]|nr:hypothetical protein LA080_009504 [Diaporthe eres]